MLFSLICIDRTDAGSMRADTRPVHLEYLKANADKIIFAGPMPKEDGSGIIGSNFLLNMEDMAAVEAFAAADPYAKAGLFSSTDARSLIKALWDPSLMVE